MSNLMSAYSGGTNLSEASLGFLEVQHHDDSDCQIYGVLSGNGRNVITEKRTTCGTECVQSS